MERDTTRDGGLRALPVLVGLLCVASFALKLWVNGPRTSPGHGDVAYYTTLARNLAVGRGFVVDYVPEFFSRPTGLPNPANTYWMPLPALLGALGMWLGGATFAAAQVAVAAFTSLAPAVTYLLGRDLLGSRSLGALGAVLAAGFHLFLFPASAPVTHGGVLVLGGLVLWTVERARSSPRWLLATGVLVALLHANRSDGFLWFLAPAALLWTSRRGGVPWRAVGGMVALYALAMSPLWVQGLLATGHPMPTGLGRTAFLTTYQELYALPDEVTLGRWLDSGAAAIWAQKWKALWTNGLTLACGLAVGAGRGIDVLRESPGLAALVLLSWLGLPRLLRRECVPALAVLAAMFALYTLVFSPTGLASFRAAMYGFYPLGLLAAAGALAGIVARLARRGHALRLGLGAAAFGALLAANVAHARSALLDGAAWIQRVRRVHLSLLHEVLEPRGLAAEVFLTLPQDVHQLHANTGLQLVSIPFGDERTARAVAERFGATHAILLERPEPSELWPAPYEITVSEHWEPVFAGEVGPGRAGVWRLR